MKEIYIVVGTIEYVGQDRIGGPFSCTYKQESVKAFTNLKKAEDYIQSRKLDKPKHKQYAGKAYYKGGYCEMEIEAVELDEDTICL